MAKPEAGPATPPAPLEIRLAGGFADALRAAGATLLCSAYFSNRIILLDLDGAGRVRLTPVAYRKPMGIAAQGARLAVTTLDEVHLYEDCPGLAEQIAPDEKRFERVFFPRLTVHCGPLDLHDIRFVGDEPWAVNTLFSCLCSFDARHSFTPRWRPPFVSAIAPEDRCHLNGLALEDGEPAYVTALGTGDAPGSWRETVTSGGVLMSVRDGEIRVRNLAMPHSPRNEGGALHLLQSARGELSRIDTRSWEVTEVVRLPGLVRGLAIRGHIAFVGVSKARDRSATFHRLAPDARVEHAAIHAIDLRSGAVLGTLTFLSFVEEIYDIQAVPGTAPLGMLGLYDERHRQAVSAPGLSFWRRELPRPVSHDEREDNQEPVA